MECQVVQRGGCPPAPRLHSEKPKGKPSFHGANTLQVLRNVILPLSRPALATVAIFTFQAAWNDFLAPLIFLHDQSLYTLQLGLSFFRGAYNVQWAYLLASSLVVTLPVIALFFFAQRSFIEGTAFTGTKI